ncbi:unnamed protein product [Alopecurus aequalis]
MEELQLLSTVDPTRRLEYELLDKGGTWLLEDEAKRRKKGNRRRCRLSFALAVRKGRFARYSLLIGSRYGMWSAAEGRFIKRTNMYHYHYLTKGIRDVRDLYLAVLFDAFDVRSFSGFLYKLFVVNCCRRRRTALILRALWFYHHAFMSKDRRMECWHDDVYGGEDKREELSSLRHRLVDVYRRRMADAQRRRVLVMYQRDRRDIWCCLGFIFLVMVLFVIIVRLLNYLRI